MRQQSQLSQQDWQLLSAYLDGQLPANDLAKLEKRLREQASLRAALDELKTTRAMLRSAGKQRVPRNFTLTPAMVEKARPRPLLRLIPVFNFASAAAALAVVILLVVGLLPGTNLSTQSAPAAAAPTLNAVEDTTGSPAPFVWNSAPQGLGGGGDTSSAAPDSAIAKGMGGGGGGGGAAGPGFSLPPQVVEDLPPESAAGQAESTQAAGMMLAPAMTATPAPAGTIAAAAPAAPEIAPQPEQPAATAQVQRQANEQPKEPLTGSGPILGVRPPDQAEVENQQVINQYAAQQNSSTQERSGWWIAPLVLALVAAAFALAAFFIRRMTAL